MTLDSKPVEPSIEEVQDVSDHEGHEHALEDNNHPMTKETHRTQSRTEKKARKALQKLGLKPVEGIHRVVLKRPKGIMFVISKPDVFKSTVADTYLIFGEARIEDMSGAAQNSAAQNFKPEGVDVSALTQGAADSAQDDDVPELEELEEEINVDEEGVEAKDIELVMKNAGVTRAKAVQAIKNNNNDIVNAIMELSM